MTATIPASELIAALIASHGGVIDCHKVAALLNMTYWKVEGQLRKPKQEATALTDKAKNEGRLDANNAVIKSALPTGNQRPGNGATQTVLTGRVTKTKTKPNTKGKKAKAVMKQEIKEDSEDDDNMA